MILECLEHTTSAAVSPWYLSKDIFSENFTIIIGRKGLFLEIFRIIWIWIFEYVSRNVGPAETSYLVTKNILQLKFPSYDFTK